MKIQYISAAMVCLLALIMVLPAFAASIRGNSDVCDPKVIGQIQQGKSTKEDVRQLIGDPDKVEKALNQGELWKYSYEVTSPSGRGSGNSFKSSSKDAMGGGRVAMDKKNCNLYVYFQKDGIVRKVSESKVSGSSGGFMK